MGAKNRENVQDTGNSSTFIPWTPSTCTFSSKRLFLPLTSDYVSCRSCRNRTPPLEKLTEKSFLGWAAVQFSSGQNRERNTGQEEGAMVGGPRPAFVPHGLQSPPSVGGNGGGEEAEGSGMWRQWGGERGRMQDKEGLWTGCC